MYKYIISYDGGFLRDSADFEWGLFDSYEETEEAANDISVSTPIKTWNLVQIGDMKMNSAELAKRIIDCLSDGYDDEEYREETETELYNELSQVGNGSIKAAFVKLCERIEELEAQKSNPHYECYS